MLQVERELLFVNHGHLAQLSPYFRALVSGSGQESTKTRFRIKDVGRQTQNHSQDFLVAMLWMYRSDKSSSETYTELKLRCFIEVANLKVPLLWVMKRSYLGFGSPQQQVDMHARSKNTFIFL